MDKCFICNSEYIHGMRGYGCARCYLTVNYIPFYTEYYTDTWCYKDILPVECVYGDCTQLIKLPFLESCAVQDVKVKVYFQFDHIKTPDLQTLAECIVVMLTDNGVYTYSIYALYKLLEKHGWHIHKKCSNLVVAKRCPTNIVYDFLYYELDNYAVF
ncbi:hypothetical protein EB118_03140 [bacterium]|nr:hypothetical protein [bacterium]NDC93959.1 hypothetical protein [bacterium]NDD83454.1 hypothetical protein [bacterium]NDG29079.1 hypothetical protein [bacterium]